MSLDIKRRYWSGAAALNNATAVDLEIVNSTASTIYVTKITLSIVTHAAKFVAIQDTNGTPKVIAKHTDAAAGAGVPSVVTWDFGDFGVPMTLGKNLQAVSEASGVVGYVYAQGYEIE